MGDAGRSRRQLLLIIVEWGERTARFLGSLSKDDFLVDELRQAAVSKCVEVVGEASGEILRRYPDFAAAHPELAFSEAYRMRNRLSHGYDTIDTGILWNTAADHVPNLLSQVRGLLLTDADPGL